MLAVALLAADGCSLPPVSVHPGLPTIARYPADPPAPGEPSAARIGWRAFFAEPELRALIVQALGNNRDLRAAAGRIEQARAALRMRGADLAPQVSGSLGMARIGVPDSAALMLHEDTLTSYNGLLQTSWEIDLFGRLRKPRRISVRRAPRSSPA